MRVGKAGDARRGRGIGDVGPGRAARAVKQRTVAVDGDAGAAARRGHPIELMAAAGRVAIDKGARPIRLDAEHELARLHVVANLRAGQPALAVMTGWAKTVLPVHIRPAVADVGTDIQSAP